MFNGLFDSECELSSPSTKVNSNEPIFYQMKSRPVILKICLTNQHHSLWGHRLWNASICISELLETCPFSSFVINKRVLELGCGAGLPSIVSYRLGAKKCILTDYPDDILLQTANKNISENTNKSIPGNEQQADIQMVGLKWGDQTTIDELIQSVPEKFGLVILSDLIFNHLCHVPLLATLSALLAEDGIALVAFTHHRPHLVEEDLNFFRLAERGQLQSDPDSPFPSLTYRPFVIRKLDTVTMTPMFHKDSGDPIIRSQVHLYLLAFDFANFNFLLNSHNKP